MASTLDQTPREPERLSRLACHPAVQGLLCLAIVSIGVAIGVAWRTVRQRRLRPPALSPLPEAHPIWDSWRAAQAGDVDAYLACFTGAARAQAEADLQRVGREAFRRQLEETAAAALAIKLRAPRKESDGSLTFPVIAQHSDDEEVLDYRVVREGSGWKIGDVTPRGRRPSSPPYRERLGPPAEREGGQK